MTYPHMKRKFKPQGQTLIPEPAHLNSRRTKQNPLSINPNTNTKIANTKTMVGVCDSRMSTAMNCVTCPATLTIPKSVGDEGQI